MTSNLDLYTLRITALVQPSPAAFDAGLRQPDAIQTNLACRLREASQFMTSVMGYLNQRQGQFKLPAALEQFGVPPKAARARSSIRE